MSQVNELTLDAAILEHASSCKRGIFVVLRWLVGILLIVGMGVTSWAYNRSSKIEVISTRVDGVDKDVTEIRAQLRALPRIEAKLDRAIGGGSDGYHGR